MVETSTSSPECARSDDGSGHSGVANGVDAPTLKNGALLARRHHGMDCDSDELEECRGATSDAHVVTDEDDVMDDEEEEMNSRDDDEMQHLTAASKEAEVEEEGGRLSTTSTLSPATPERSTASASDGGFVSSPTLSRGR